METHKYTYLLKNKTYVQAYKTFEVQKAIILGHMRICRLIYSFWINCVLYNWQG